MNDMQHTVTVVTLAHTTRKRRFCFGAALPDTTRFEGSTSRVASHYDPAPLTEREKEFATDLRSLSGIVIPRLRPTHASIIIEPGADWEELQPQIIARFVAFLGWSSDSYAVVNVPEWSQPQPLLVGTQPRGYIGEQLLSMGVRN
jgi:hypothetical protein